MRTHPISRPTTVVPQALADLAGVLGDRVSFDVRQHAAADESRTVTGVTHDSRSVQAGDLYAALPGANRHGAEFLADAVKAGAVAVLTDPVGARAAAEHGLPALVAENPRAVLGELAAVVYGRPTERLAVIGVTGTSGKTTTAYLIESGLAAAGHRTGMIGTVETRIGDDRLTSAYTTPEAPDLQALFALMVERGVTAVAMEVSSHALAMGRVDGTHFAVGAFTNLGSDHLDFHADTEDYFAAKAKLFDGRSAARAVNVDDSYGRRLVDEHTQTVSMTGSDASWWVDQVDSTEVAQTFTVHGPDEARYAGGVGLPGPFNIANALVAIASLAAAGVDPETAVRGVAACPGVPGRLERVSAPRDVLGIVDYAHKPDAVTAVLAVLRPVTRGRLIVVLGCGGDRDRFKRPLMGEAGARGADVLVVTDDNPRTEDPALIRAAAIEGAERVPEDQRARVWEIGDRAEAIAHAAALAEEGDTIAVLGKGHEPYQEINGVTYGFDDREVLGAALASGRSADDTTELGTRRGGQVKA